ncbi:MAG: hypothetical protein CM15mP115_20150 [Alphaproteobacteria bacterium]|nr:MAG: hypothetical protein CM15mP115_20150 [Alphaproteobacteria bacterium]
MNPVPKRHSTRLFAVDRLSGSGADGSGETIVKYAAFAEMFRWIPDCTRHEFAGARHELLYETADVQIDMWRRIDRFLDGITGDK